MTEEEYEKWWNGQPESKFELIDGQLIIGNSLVGSQLLFRMILEGWGAESVVALVDSKLVLQTLKVVYSEAPIDSSESIIQNWASQVNYQPADLSAGSQPLMNGQHFRARDFLYQQLLTMIDFGLEANLTGSDFVMRLGNNAFTPDMLIFCGKPLNCIYNWYLEGPADLVIEVILPNHAKQDREVKRDYYEAGGVPEYWIIDPLYQQVEFLRLENGQYQRQHCDNEGRYSPHNLPNLVFWPLRLWSAYRRYDYDRSGLIFTLEPWPEKSRHKPVMPEEGGFKPYSIPPSFRVGLDPVAISFQEFVSWCPKTKIEYADRIDIGCELRVKSQ